MASRVAPQRRKRRHHSDPLPLPGRENWLGLGLMISAAVSVPAATYWVGFPGGVGGMASLPPVIAIMAYYLFIGLGMWLVRPVRGHRLAFRLSLGFMHLQAACFLLMWSGAFGFGVSPDPFRPRSAFALAATGLSVFAFVPAFVLLKRARDAKLLFVVQMIVPFGVGVALAIVGFGWLVITIRRGG